MVAFVESYQWPRYLGSISIREAQAPSRSSGPGTCASPAGRHLIYTWGTPREIEGDVPPGLQIGFRCLIGSDGLRRFAPLDGLKNFVAVGNAGGLALQSFLTGATKQQRFSHRFMYLVNRLAPRIQEHFARPLLRADDLHVRKAVGAGSNGIRILPSTIGLNNHGEGTPWSVPELLEQGRRHCQDDGVANPTESECIQHGLLAAATLNPLNVDTMSDQETSRLVRLALFDLGPANERIDEPTLDLVTGRLVDALERHIDDDDESFDRWFFGQFADIVHQIAKRKRPGGSLQPAIVRQAILELAFRSYKYVGDCVATLAIVFGTALSPPLNERERQLFEAFYVQQTYLGGLPLVMLHERLDFLRPAVLGVLNEPTSSLAKGVLLRKVQYYGEMASKRREVNRTLKGEGTLRIDHGGPDSQDKTESAHSKTPARSSTVVNDIVYRYCKEQGLLCPCQSEGFWSALVDEKKTRADLIALDVGCEQCGYAVSVEVPKSEFERLGRCVGIPDGER